MRVLVHLSPHAPYELLGVWCPPSDDGQLRGYYPYGGHAEEYGRSCVIDELEFRPWLKVAERLAMRTPYSAWWEAIDLPITLGLHEAFDEVLSRAEVSWTADLLAERTGLPTEPLEAGGHRLSTLFSLHADDGTLAVLVSNPDLPQRQVDLALAHGLAWAGDRDLALVLPSGRVEPTRERAAFIDIQASIWEFDATGVRPVTPLTQGEVLERFSEELRGQQPHDLSDRANWVADLTTWANEQDELHAVARPTYLAWHCDGRQVLKIQRSAAGLTLVAGVDYQSTTDRPEPLRLELLGPLDDDADVRAAVTKAVDDRLSLVDDGHIEHRFQARLAQHATDLGFVRILREVPARRAGGGTAFIDLMGITSAGDLRAVETKLGNDDMLALQALDYWIWATANQARISKELLDGQVKQVGVDVLVASRSGTSNPVGSYTAAQLEALDPKVRWRFRVCENWRSESLSVTTSPSRTMPPNAPRRCDPRWAVRLHQHVLEAAAEAGQTVRAGTFHHPPTAGMVPAAAATFQALDEADRHGSAAHLRSSQAFALNLFAPLGEDELVALCRRLSIPAVSASPARFELGDPDGLLGEATSSSSHTTQIDVAIPAVLEDGTRHLLAVEVKLSETDFGHCTAWSAKSNDTRHVCDTGLPFGGDATRCFQLRNLDRGPRRRYDQHLAFHDPTTRLGGCWFRGGANQVMRNVALLNALRDAGQIDSATLVLCAPLAHAAIWRRWNEGTDLLWNQGVALKALPADAVAAYNPDLTESTSLAERYLLDARVPAARRHRLAWQARLDAAFPEGAALALLDSDEPYYAHIDPWPLVQLAGPDWCVVEILTPEDTKNPVGRRLEESSFEHDDQGRVVARPIDVPNELLVQPEAAPLVDDWRRAVAELRKHRNPDLVRDEIVVDMIGPPRAR